MKELLSLSLQDKQEAKRLAGILADDPAMLWSIENIVETIGVVAIYQETDLELADKLNFTEEIINQAALKMKVKISFPEPEAESLAEWAQRLLKQIRAFPGFVPHPPGT